MKRILFGAALTLLFLPLSFAQTGGWSEESLAALQRAVVEIAVTNHTISSVIYDGMSVQDVEAILQKPVDVTVSTNFSDNPMYWYVSYHANYVVFWTSLDISTPAFVIGHMRIGEARIRHNYVDSEQR